MSSLDAYLIYMLSKQVSDAYMSGARVAPLPHPRSRYALLPPCGFGGAWAPSPPACGFGSPSPPPVGWGPLLWMKNLWRRAPGPTGPPPHVGTIPWGGEAVGPRARDIYHSLLYIVAAKGTAFQDLDFVKRTLSIIWCRMVRLSRRDHVTVLHTFFEKKTSVSILAQGFRVQVSPSLGCACRLIVQSISA